MYKFAKEFAAKTRHNYTTIKLLPEALFSLKTIEKLYALTEEIDPEQFMDKVNDLWHLFTKALAAGMPVKVKPIAYADDNGEMHYRSVDISITDSALTRAFGWTNDFDVSKRLIEVDMSTLFGKRLNVSFDELEAVADFSFVQQQKESVEKAYVELGAYVIEVLNKLGINYNGNVYHMALRSPGQTRRLRSIWAEDGFRKENAKTFNVFGLRFSDVFGVNGEKLATMTKVEQWKANTAYSVLGSELFGLPMNVKDITVVPERKAALKVPFNRVLGEYINVYACDIIKGMYGNTHMLTEIVVNPIDGSLLYNLDKALRMGLITDEQYRELLGTGFQFRSNGGALKGYGVFVSGDRLTAKLPISEFTDRFGDKVGKADWLMLCDESVTKAIGCTNSRESWYDYIANSELSVIRVSDEPKKVVKTSRQLIEKLPTIRDGWLLANAVESSGKAYGMRTEEGFNAAISTFATMKPFVGCGIENSSLAHAKVESLMRRTVVDTALNRFEVEGTLADMAPDSFAAIAFMMNVKDWQKYAHVKEGCVCLNTMPDNALMAAMRHPFNSVNALVLVNQNIPAFGEHSSVVFCNITTAATAVIDGDYDGDEMWLTICRAIVDAACALNKVFGMLFTGENDFPKTMGKKSITRENYMRESAKSTFAAYYYDGIGTGSTKMSRAALALEDMIEVSIDFAREIMCALRYWVQLLVDSPKYECFAPSVDPSLAFIMKKYKVTDSLGRYSFANWLNECIGRGYYTNKYRDASKDLRPDDKRYAGMKPCAHRSMIPVKMLEENNIGWDLPSFPERKAFDPATLTHSYYSRGNAVKKVELNEERCKVILGMLKESDPARTYIVPGAKLSIVSIIKMLYKSSTKFLSSMAETMDDGKGMKHNKACFMARQALARTIVNDWVELIPSYGQLDESKKIGLVWSILVDAMVINNPKPMSDELGEREGANGCLQWLLETIPEGLAQVLEDNGIEALTEGVAPVCELEDDFDIDSVEEPRW